MIQINIDADSEELPTPPSWKTLLVFTVGAALAVASIILILVPLP